jgi:glyoxylate reductase
MHRVFVTRRLAADPLELLDTSPDAALAGAVTFDVFAGDQPPTREVLLERTEGAAGVITLVSDRIDAALLDARPGLRVVAQSAVGVDNIDLAACRARGIAVTHTPDVLTEATADLTWALLLAVARRVGEGERLVRSGRPWAWGPRMLLGRELFGATLGIVGLGRIGAAVARRAAGFGMRVIYTTRGRATSSPPEAVRVGLDRLLAASDIVSLHVPLTDETHHLIDAGALASMKPGALLLNTARGPVIDEAALVNALASGHLGGAGLDVYEAEPRVHPALLERDDVVLLPHIGSATVHTRRRMAALAVVDAARVLHGLPPHHPVPLDG